MAQKPILVIQMRRLGDLILTFPLLVGLQKHRPENPARIVARPEFFRGLMPFAPAATFFPPAALEGLSRHSYEAILNLGAGSECAIFTGKTGAIQKFGELRKENTTRVAGFWELYRAALTQNNRHNLFHWADLNRLDLLDSLSWPVHGLQKRPKTGKVGLFIGASEASKRPAPEFWASLARRLSHQGLMPLILGGPAEKEAGQLVARACGLERANFCGKMNLMQLGHILKSIDLLISPDTGPMHLADWLGTAVLNLSMGNVNAYETGPLAKGQIVARAAMSCAGCWGCARGRLYCHKAFSPGNIARLTEKLLDGQLPATNELPGLEILRVNRDSRGLRALERIDSEKKDARMDLSLFWKQVFLHQYFLDEQSVAALRGATEELARRNPALFDKVRAHLSRIPAALLRAIKTGQPLPETFWRTQPPHSRLFAGWLQMRLENASHSRSEIGKILEELGNLSAMLAMN